MAEDQAFQTMLERALRVFTRRLARLLDAERASLLLVNEREQTLELRVSQDLDLSDPVVIPIGTGIAGTVAKTGEPIRIDDAYEDPRFNPDVDRKSGFRTRSILCLPVRNQSGDVFAVAQALNRRDGLPFEDSDEQKFSRFVSSLGVVLEALDQMHGKRRLS